MESYSWWYQLLFSGQIAFATQTSSVKYEVSDLWGDEKKIIISPLTIYDGWRFIPSPWHVTFPCIIFSVAAEQGVIHKEESALPIHCSAVLNFSFDQPVGLLMGAKSCNLSRRPLHALEYLSGSEMICYANHYSYLTTCRVATLVLMAAQTGRPLLMLTATPSAEHTHHTGLLWDS